MKSRPASRANRVGGPRQSRRQSSADVNSNSSSVSTSTREKQVDHFLLHCDESPMGALRSHALPPTHEEEDPATTTTTTQTQKTAAQKRVELEQILELGKIELETREDKRDLFQRMKATDEETRPDPDYLERHSGKQLPNEYLNSNMRTICCGWMVELSLEFSFQQETLMLAIRIFDRYLSLSSEPVSRKVLQLVAISSMLVASKMEEVVHPSVKDFSRMSADTFSTADVKRMEVVLLQTLGYRVHSPSICAYVEIIHLSGKLGGDKVVREEDWGKLGLGAGSSVEESVAAGKGRAYHLTCYLLELCLVSDIRFLSFAPAMAAAACALVVLGGAWPRALEHLTGYSRADLLPCARLVQGAHEAAEGDDKQDSPLAPLKEKYRVLAKSCVSSEKPASPAFFAAADTR